MANEKYMQAAKARNNKRTTTQVKNLYGDALRNNNSTRGGTPAQQKVKLANTIIPGGSTPQATNQQNFSAAFKKARKELGPGKTFKFKLKNEKRFKNYSTNYKEEG